LCIGHLIAQLQHSKVAWDHDKGKRGLMMMSGNLWRERKDNRIKIESSVYLFNFGALGFSGIS